MLWCQKLGSVPKHIENWDMSFKKTELVGDILRLLSEQGNYLRYLSMPLHYLWKIPSLHEC